MSQAQPSKKIYEELPAQHESVEKRVKLLKLSFADEIARQKTLVATELPLDTWYQIRVSTKLAYPLPIFRCLLVFASAVLVVFTQLVTVA